MSIPSRPTTPYISLDDLHTETFFTKDRIQKHLRRAGLLNRNAEILTQAEYESKQKDFVIGRENQRKLDDAIIEVLKDMAREHWAYARNHTEDVKKHLMHEFRRIEKQYSRRTQPIAIQYTKGGRIQLESLERVTNNRSKSIDNSTRPPVSSLPRVHPPDLSSRSRSSQSANIQRSTELADIRKELNDLKNKLANFNDHRIKTSQDQISENFGHPQTLQEQITELNREKLNLQQVLPILDDLEQKTQQKIEDFSGKITDLLETKPDYQTVKRLIQESGAHGNQRVVNEDQHELRKMQVYSNNLNLRSNEQPITTSTSTLANKSKPKEHSFTGTLNSEELQAFMPYIELLPTFDMFNENEWI